MKARSGRQARVLPSEVLRAIDLAINAPRYVQFHMARAISNGFSWTARWPQKQPLTCENASVERQLAPTQTAQTGSS